MATKKDKGIAPPYCPYSPKLVEDVFSELRLYRVLPSPPQRPLFVPIGGSPATPEARAHVG